MVRRLKDLSPSELGLLPNTSGDHSSMGEEMIHLHLFNREEDELVPGRVQLDKP